MGWGGPAELSPKKGWAELDPKDLFLFSFLGRDSTQKIGSQVSSLYTDFMKRSKRYII
jgi:hypothetical protein